jgi:hypothetical protein
MRSPSSPGFHSPRSHGWAAREVRTGSRRAGAEQCVQRGAQRAAADGAEGTRVGDGLEAGRVLDRPGRGLAAVNRVLAGEEFPQPVAHRLRCGPGERSLQAEQPGGTELVMLVCGQHASAPSLAEPPEPGHQAGPRVLLWHGPPGRVKLSGAKLTPDRTSREPAAPPGSLR